MKMTLELELHDQPNPEHFQNFLGYAALLDRRAVSGLTGAVPKGLPATPLVDQSTDEGETSTETATTTTGRPRGRPRRTTSVEQATAALEGASDPVKYQWCTASGRSRSRGADDATPPATHAVEASPLPPGVGPPQPRQRHSLHLSPKPRRLPPGVGARGRRSRRRNLLRRSQRCQSCRRRPPTVESPSRTFRRPMPSSPRKTVSRRSIS